MDFMMTRNTNSFNIKPMLFSIAFVVMVLLCLFTTGAFKSAWLGNSVETNSVADCVSGFSFFRMHCPCFSLALTSCYFSFFASIVFCLYNSFPFLVGFCPISPLLALIVFSTTMFVADFTLPLQAVFSKAVLLKLRNGFNLLATATSFCYDGFRHGFFLFKKLCFEPLQTRRLCGFSHYTTIRGNVNGF